MLQYPFTLILYSAFVKLFSSIGCSVTHFAYSLFLKSSVNVDVENVVNIPVIGLPSSNFISAL